MRAKGYVKNGHFVVVSVSDYKTTGKTSNRIPIEIGKESVLCTINSGNKKSCELFFNPGNQSLTFDFSGQKKTIHLEKLAALIKADIDREIA